MKEAPDCSQSGASSLWKMPSGALKGARRGGRAGGWVRKGGQLAGLIRAGTRCSRHRPYQERNRKA